ncbi:synaptotagmin-3-like isoform X2 [Macadamia integrifolia]|uniref:synaptotagmin-3-like isoform X2 n=1 Tax=Macadamia integrifolia TaxID=60698 RepID=UPI001C52753C|nr:synaptotagmin-3-like isoform X2 [Macadamia integrifolia]
MGFIGSFFGIIGFAFGIPIGLFLGFLLFIFFEPSDVKEPIVTPLYDLDSNSLYDLLPEIPLWVKSPDYERAICSTIRSMAAPIFAEYIGKFQIKSIEFESLTLGTLPPTIHGIKVYDSNEKELVIEPVVRWAGNPNITLVLKLLSLRITVQLVDLQIFAAPRVTLKPLVPSFPCFASVVVSLMEKPHVDFGLKFLGGDIMAIPGLYRFVQETIKREVGKLYLWPLILEIPILDSTMLSMKKPVGILHVTVIRAVNLLKMDFLGTSDPYVKLSLTGEKLPAKKTTVKMKNLNPEWNEEFKLIVKDPESQVLQLLVYDWDKVGTHDKLGMQVVPLRLLSPHETKEFTLDLLKNINPNDPHNKKRRGQIFVELTFKPFIEDIDRFSGPLDGYMKKGSMKGRKESMRGKEQDDVVSDGPGVLLVTVRGAEDVEGKNHNNPYALVLFRGEQKKTKMIRKNRDPSWNEEFQFMLEEAPINQRIHIEVMSKRTGFSFRHKESLGYVEINLTDVVNNGRINSKYNLIDSKNGVIHIEIQWNTI